MSTVSAKPPVRHGSCRLILTINGDEYQLRRGRGSNRTVKIWSLTKHTAAGLDIPVYERPLYFVTRSAGQLACTCPDHTHRGARCKHLRALVAAGLVCGRTSPSLVNRKPKGGV